MAGAMVHAPTRADLSVRFTVEQQKVILDTCCGGAAPNEAKALIAIAEARGLNPILGECYFVKRYDSQTGKEKWAVQAAIDSFRIKAEQTGLYAGQDEPEYEYDKDGFVTLARVKVWRKDWPRPAVGVARWSEYVQTKKDGSPTRFWAQMPHNQLAKCAEALALRKAFPAVLSKVYVTEEMDQAENAVPYTPAATQIGPARTAPALTSGIEPGLFESMCAQIDAAETKAAINKVAVAAKKALAAGALSAPHYGALGHAAETKRKLIASDKPSDPVAPAVSDDGPGYDDASEAEADAVASRYDT
jgi:phage recombination protein Bet